MKRPVEGYHRITAQKAKEIMESGKPYVLLDVRSQVEHNLKYIEGDILIPHREIAEKRPSCYRIKTRRSWFIAPAACVAGGGRNINPDGVYGCL